MGEQVPHGWGSGDDALERHTRFRGELQARGEWYVLGAPCTTTVRDLEEPLPAYQGRGRRPKALRLYVNGVQVSSRAQKGNLVTSTNPLSIGRHSIFGRYFQGTIDEVRIYNQALRLSEIQADMGTPIR